MKERKIRWTAVIAAFVLGAAAAAGGLYAWMKAGGVIFAEEKTYDEYRRTAEKYEKLDEIEKLIEEDYLWDADENALLEAACGALLAALGDPYSRYLSEEEIAGMESRLSGDMVGVGIRIYENEDGAPAVSDVISESPADASGIEAGDIIRKIDGKKVSTTEEVSSALYGEAGTTVSVTYERDGEETTVSLVRGEIRDSSVNSVMLEDNVGYIRIKTFGEKTAADFASELSAMEKRQAQGVIIDLRGNSGGLMEQGIAIADALLPEGTIVYTEDKNGDRETFNSDSVCTSLKYVLLVDGETASAAEIVAAAVKDNGGGKLIGERTYGKGVIQETVFFDDGTGVSLTARQYFSPSGATIHEKGVKPDIETGTGDERGRDLQLEAAIEEITGQPGKGR